MQNKVHRTSVDVPADLWEFYQSFKDKTRKSFASFVIDSLIELKEAQKEAEARELELVRARRLHHANRHLG